MAASCNSRWVHFNRTCMKWAMRLRAATSKLGWQSLSATPASPLGWLSLSVPPASALGWQSLSATPASLLASMPSSQLAFSSSSASCHAALAARTSSTDMSMVWHSFHDGASSSKTKRGRSAAVTVAVGAFLASARSLLAHPRSQLLRMCGGQAVMILV